MFKDHSGLAGQNCPGGQVFNFPEMLNRGPLSPRRLTAVQPTTWADCSATYLLAPISSTLCSAFLRELVYFVKAPRDPGSTA